MRPPLSALPSLPSPHRPPLTALPSPPCRYVEKEEKIASLLKYSEKQGDELSELEAQLTVLQALDRHGEGEGAESSSLKASDALEADGSPKKAPHVRAHETFDGVCRVLESMFRAAKCPGGLDLGTKGCSTSTVAEFMSAIATRLDELQMVAGGMRCVP